ncbi:hypothetical protein DFJ74DRAFT_703508 [Hyaloraphidium curvatum]|nr:hypothetical protein DFJ74DRAFT_703508 [Hyaloraphidium curvatum]
MDPAKKRQEEVQVKKLQALISSDPANALCADCGAKGTRWGSTNLGALLCIRCGGLHRKLGTHISRIKSLSLDIWAPEILESFLAIGGNPAVNSKYLPRPDLVGPPPTNDDMLMEQYIRDKYERKRFMGPGGRAQNEAAAERVREPSPKPPPKPAGPSQQELKDKYRTHLAKLANMGFTDEKLNLQLLAKYSGSINDTVDYLLSHATNGMHSNGIAEPGRFDEGRAPDPLGPPPTQQRNRSQPAPKAPAAASKDIDDIFGDFVSSSPQPLWQEVVSVPSAAPPAPAPVSAPVPDPRTNAKAQILSLYNVPQPRPAMMMQPMPTQQQAQGQNPFAVAPAGMGGMGGTQQANAWHPQHVDPTTAWPQQQQQVQRDPFDFGSATNGQNGNPFF